MRRHPAERDRCFDPARNRQFRLTASIGEYFSTNTGLAQVRQH
jgi:hypothetical protein